MKIKLSKVPSAKNQQLLKVSSAKNQQLSKVPSGDNLELSKDPLLKTRGWGIAQLVERRTGTPLRQVRFPGAARDFSFDADSLTVSAHPRRHVKDHVVHVRVRWIMETLKHPACTVDWIRRSCRSWLSVEKATKIVEGRNSNRTIQ